MRLFTALDVPDALRDRCSLLQEELGLPARWTPANQYHITLRFIGEVDREGATRYEEALARIQHRPVQCIPAELGTLPSRRSPRVLMLEFDRTESLMSLYRAVSEALEAEGLDSEQRRYRPHLTIARLDDPNPERVHEVLRSHDLSLNAFEATGFSLYESTLTSDGAVHEAQALYPLEP